MGRFSPTVLPERGPNVFDELGEGLSSVADGLENRRLRKRQEHTDLELDQDRTRRIGHEDEAWQRERELNAHQKLTDAIALYGAGYRGGDAPPGGGDVASAIERTRGNMLPGEGGYQAQPPTAQYAGNQTQMGPGPGMQPQVSGAALPQQGQPGMAAAPHPITTIGQRFFKLPGQDGYLDLDQTPEARLARQNREAEDYKFGHEGQLKTQEHGFKTEEQGAEHGYRVNEEQVRGAGEASRDRARFTHENYQERLKEGGAERVARIRADAVAAGRNGGGPTGPQTLDARGRMVSRQIRDTQKALDDEGEELGMQADPDSSNYNRIASSLDSLRGVGDQVAAARGGDPGAARGIMTNINHGNYQQELDRLTQNRERMIARARGNPQALAKIDAAYATDANALSRQYGPSLGAGHP